MVRGVDSYIGEQNLKVVFRIHKVVNLSLPKLILACNEKEHNWYLGNHCRDDPSDHSWTSLLKREAEIQIEGSTLSGVITDRLFQQSEGFGSGKVTW